MLDRHERTADRSVTTDRSFDDPAEDPTPSPEEFLEGSWSYCKWLYRAVATSFGRMLVNDGYLPVAPAAGDAPPRLEEEIEEQCVARAEIVFFYSLMLPEAAKQASPVIPEALIRPLRDASGAEMPFSEVVFRRIIWLFVLMLHDKHPVSDRFRRELAELWDRHWPDYHGEEVTFQRITDWQCWVSDNEASLIDRLRMLKLEAKLGGYFRFF